jgi:hypothetical protein
LQQGPLVNVLHTKREMRIFGVTENELRTITIMNAATAFFFSLGTGCFGYLLNLQADAAFADKIPAATQRALDVFRPGLEWVGAAFYVAGIVTWLYRGGFVRTIKRESVPPPSAVVALAASTRPNWFVRVWDAIRS